MDNRPHGLQTGQSVVFREVHGMEELNGTVQRVSGIIDHLFTLLNIENFAIHLYIMPTNISHRNGGKKTLD